jgi:HK97 family phage prohead protease
MDPQRLFTRVEIKAVDTSQRLIDGYAAYIGNKDRTGDVIDKGAFDRTIKENSDVVAFIGHDSSKLQVGEAISMLPDGAGLRTTTSIYNTADGDALLEVAKRRLARGKTLGMSIGYRVAPGGSKMIGGVRHLTDVDLVEYSFLASPDFAANPLATVLGVKAKKAVGLGQVITTDDSYEELIDDLEDAIELALGVPDVCVVATFTDHVVVCVQSPTFDPDDMTFYDIPYTLDAGNEPTLGEPSLVAPAFVPEDAKARALARASKSNNQETNRMPQHDTQPWDAAFVASLPDDAFAYIEGNGLATKDDTGRTVPRSLRHYAHHHQDGSVDAEHLAHALKHAATPVIGVDGEAHENETGTKALAHLESHAYAEEHGIDSHAAEWSEGAAAALLIIGYKTDRIIADIAKDRLAMERTGIDTKKGARLNSGMRTRLKELHSSLGQILEWADRVEKGEDGKMLVDMFRHRLRLLQLDEVS